MEIKDKSVVFIRDATIHFPHDSLQTSIYGSWFCFALKYDLCITKQQQKAKHLYIIYEIRIFSLLISKYQ